MNHLKTNFPRIWCIIVAPLALIILALAAIFAYVCHFLSNLKRIWLNLWDDLRSMFLDPYRETCRAVGRYSPWSDIAATWNKASK